MLFLRRIMRRYFSITEILIWFTSVFVITVSFFAFDGKGYLTLVASLIGVTSLIFASKGNPVSQLLMIIFSILYGVISYGFRYYGEMITYLAMTLPMAVLSLVSWLKNRHTKSEVAVNDVNKNDRIALAVLTVVVTAVFYFVLKYFNTHNLIPSTLSIATSFAAAFLTYKRSPYFAFVYALNDLVLIVLWVLASLTDISYISVVICFVAFFVNDMYCFFSWRKMAKRQKIG